MTNEIATTVIKRCKRARTTRLEVCRVQLASYRLRGIVKVFADQSFGRSMKGRRRIIPLTTAMFIWKIESRRKSRERERERGERGKEGEREIWRYGRRGSLLNPWDQDRFAWTPRKKANCMFAAGRLSNQPEWALSDCRPAICPLTTTGPISWEGYNPCRLAWFD